MYKALYRKWRPMSFDDVISQNHITDTLKNQIVNNKTAHAYLFTGSRGTGKTTCARILAKAVNCLSMKNGNPCQVCDICTDADNGNLTDITEIDAASNNGVDDIRDLRDGTVYTPERGNYKVYIIDEVHMLSSSAFNALLKIMEEPPAYVKFILATTEIHKVPATITSRCQRYDFRRIKSEDIAKRLLYIANQENINLSDIAADLIAKISDGGMRDAISLLDQCSVCADEITPEIVSNIAGIAGRDYLYNMIEAIIEKNTAKAIEISSELYSLSKDLTKLCEELIMQFRNIMLIKFEPNSAQNLITCLPDEWQRLNDIASNIEIDKIMSQLDTLQTCREKMGRVLNKRVEFEMTLIKLCNNISKNSETSSESVDNSEIYDKIKRLEDKLKSAVVANSKDSLAKPIPSPKVTAEPVPNVDLKSVKLEQVPKMAKWQQILDEFKKVNPSVSGSLEGSYAQNVGNVIFITSNNRFFISLFKNKDNAMALGETISRVLGSKHAIRARCLVSPEEQRNMAEALINKAKDSNIQTAVE